MPRQVVRFAEMNRLDAVDLALYGGEEYELVVTVKPNLWGEAQKTAEQAGGALYRIGEVTRRRGIILRTRSGEIRKIAPKGYEHFK